MKRSSPPGSSATGAIGRRSMLKSSALGGAIVAESLFAGLLPKVSLAAGITTGQSQTPPQSSGGGATKPLGEIEPIKLEYVFQIRIDFSERVSFQTPNGRRAYVPAVSGVIEGPRLQGKVVP